MANREIRNDKQEVVKEEETQEVKEPLNELLLDLDEVQQVNLVAVVMEDYRNAKEAREKTDWGTTKHGDGKDFDEKYADLITLYEGADEKRPEKWMCGRSLKIAQAIVELLVARLLPAVWNEDVIRWRPVERTDKKRVERVNKIMHWVLNVWMKMGQNFAPEFVRVGIMMGSVITETHWDVHKLDLDETENVAVNGPDGKPLLNDDGSEMTIESRLLKVDEKPKATVVPLEKFLTQPGSTDIQREPVIKLEDFYFHELEGMQKEGMAQNITDKLKSEVDKSIITKFGEELSSQEKIADLSAKRRMKNVETLIWYGPWDADEDGFAEEICVMVSLREEIYIRSFKTSKISRRGRRPFRITNFVDRIHKLLGIGVLEQVKPLAEEIDACFRQLQDANTMSVLQWGFYDPNSDYDPDEHVARPRSMYPVTNPQQNVYFPQINIPIERLLNAIRLVLEFVERLTAASSFMLGKESEIAGGSGTATRTQAIVSSAETRFNLPASKFREGIAGTITDIFDLCHLNMPAGLERRILGEDGEQIFDNTEAVQDAFANEMDAYLMPNASFGDVNTQRELAVLLYDKFVMGGNPLIVSDPNRIWHATANVFKAYGEEPLEWIGKPASNKETNDPEVEHTMIREGQVVRVEPQENHLEHLLVHQQFFQELTNSPDVLLWPKPALESFRLHMQEHERMMQQLLQFQNSGKKGADNGANTGGEGEVAGRSGAAPQQLGIQSDANPANAAAANQVKGTTAGTPEVR